MSKPIRPLVDVVAEIVDVRQARGRRHPLSAVLLLSWITVIEENWSSAGEARLPLDAAATVGLRDSVTTTYTVAGWLHSPRNVPAAAPVR